MFVLVVCTAEQVQAVQRLVKRHTSLYSAVSIQPIVPKSRERDGLFVSSQMNAFAARCQGSVEAILMEGVACQQERLRDSIRLSPRATTMIRLRQQLPELLRELGVDLVSQTAETLRQWMHGLVDRDHILAWLGQFDRLATHRWVGEGLLRVLDFWSAVRLGNALDVTSMTTFDRICVNSRRPGKSAGVVAAVIKKRLNAIGVELPIVDLHKTLADGQLGKLLYVEDSLLSGTEMLRLLRDLIGETEPGRKGTTPAVGKDTLLRAHVIQLRFGIVASLGYGVVRKFLKTQGLRNVEWFNPEAEHLDTLTPDGRQALDDGVLFAGGGLANHERHIRKVAFEETGVWRKKRERAIEFCKVVGRQLIEQYARREGREWSADQIDACALGMSNQALALAFAHSVPRSSLPLFWLGGDVTVGGNRVAWIPLFPNAEA